MSQIEPDDTPYWRLLSDRVRVATLYISLVSVPLSFQLGYISIIDWGLAAYIDFSTVLQFIVNAFGIFSGFAVLFGCVYILLCIVFQFAAVRSENGLEVRIGGRNFGSPTDFAGLLTTIFNVLLAIVLVGFVGAITTMFVVALVVVLGVFSTADWRKPGSIRCLFSEGFLEFERKYSFGRVSILRTLITQLVLIAFIVGRMFGDVVNHEDCQTIESLNNKCATLVFETASGFVLISETERKIFFVSYENGPVFTQEARGRLL